MKTYKISPSLMQKYEQELGGQERAPATISKYRHDLSVFATWLKQNETTLVTKEVAISYKSYLIRKYAPASVNSMLAALNGFFTYMGWLECRVKPLKIQPSAYSDGSRELTKEEYGRLVQAANQRNDERLCYLLQTICATGIRVSELVYITFEAVAKGSAVVRNKGKTRTVFLPTGLCQKLKRYCKKRNIRKGSVFISGRGNPLNRCNIWTMMKSLCAQAGVAARKVYPHNLRHLFARCFYRQMHDLDHLAAILGHSNINTTRIYTKTTGEEYRKQIERLALIL